MTLPFFRLRAAHGAPLVERSGQTGRTLISGAWRAVKFGAAQIDREKIDAAAGIPHLTVDRPPQARRGPQPLSFPLPMPPKVAVIEARFAPAKNQRWFDRHDGSWRAWQPDALVVPLSLGLLMADRKRCGLADLPDLTVALVALSSLADGPMDERQRGRLWRAFQVPVFEQLQDRDGSIVARECEVRHGLHLDPDAVADVRAGELRLRNEPTGIAGDIVYGCCECGAESPRLTRVAPLRMAVGAAR